MLGSASSQKNSTLKLENIEKIKLCECSFYYLSEQIYKTTLFLRSLQNILFKSLPKYYEQKTQKEELISKKDLCEEICVSFQKQDCSRDIFWRFLVILDCDDIDNDPSESLLKAFICRLHSWEHYIDLSWQFAADRFTDLFFFLILSFPLFKSYSAN